MPTLDAAASFVGGGGFGTRSGSRSCPSQAGGAVAQRALSPSCVDVRGAGVADGRRTGGRGGSSRDRLRRSPEMPRAFILHVCGTLGLAAKGALELRRFLRSSTRPLKSSFRVNALKGSQATVKELKGLGWKLDPVPWCKDGFFVEFARRRYALGQSRQHLTGKIYGQEPTSMAPVETLCAALRAVASQDSPPADEKVMRVLDLCAAPGSKTTQLAAKLPQMAVILANDPDPSRARALRANLLRAGASNSLVLQTDGRAVGGLAPEAFDAVLADVPCSAEGNMRKHAGTLDYWLADDHQAQVEQRVELQWELLRSAWAALKPGGCLVYSTCTLNAYENEQMCNRLTSDPALGARPLDVRSLLNLSRPASSAAAPPAPKWLKVWPQEFDTEGFFISAFQKEPSFQASSVAPADASQEAEEPTQAKLRVLPAGEAAAVRRQIAEQLGTCPLPAGSAAGAAEATMQIEWQLAEDEAGRIWSALSHADLQGSGLATLVDRCALKPPGLHVATRQKDSLAVSNELILVAGDGDDGGVRNGRMTEEDWAVLGSRVEATVGAMNAAMDVFVEQGDIKSAEGLLEEMTKQDLVPDAVSFTILMKAHAKKGSREGAQAAERVLQRAMKLEEERPDAITLDALCYGTMLYAFARAGDARKAEQWMRKMKEQEVEPDAACYNSLVHAWANAGKPARAEEWFQTAQQKGLAVGSTLYASLLNAFAKQGDLASAEGCFERLLGSGVEPDLMCFNTLLNACSRAGEPAKAESWLRKMMVQPDETSFNAVIAAYSHANDRASARRIYEEMCSRRLQPTTRTYAALAFPDKRDGDWQAVESILGEMEGTGLPKDGVAYALLLSAYGNARPKRVKEAEALLSCMDKKYLKDKAVQAAIRRVVGEGYLQGSRRATAGHSARRARYR
eukprot:TRINITY_DN59903_c0_g1_i1.p1 TRINITY_DN59903_c0_g1~~TRINITY_DN59903_c0_g1_i1.p1  ORF type:complete len:908 (+),score=178.17 TRINITY_DN59903_c0_g1_i1:94-2817(+)